MKIHFKTNRTTSVIIAAILTAAATIVAAYISTTQTTISRHNYFYVKAEEKEMTNTKKVLTKKSINRLNENQSIAAKSKIISGVTKDYSNGDFIKDVTVSVGGFHSTTGANGKFSIEIPLSEIEDSTIQLDFFKEGYSNLSRLYPIQENINVLLKKEDL